MSTPSLKSNGNYIPRFNVTGDRPYVETVNGPYINGIFDGTCAMGSLVLGYTTDLFEKLKEEKFYMFSNLRFNHTKMDDLAARLQRKTLTDVYFCGNTGSDAVEAAIKLAYDNTGKRKIIARQHAFHGATINANGLGNYPAWTQYEPLFSENIVRIPFNESITTLSELCAYDLEFIKQQKDVGCVIIEPYPSIVYGSRYKFDNPSCYNELREYCTANNIFLIFDEVYTGAGKTGKYIFTEYLDIDPDLVCLAKGITAGMMPFSVLLGKPGVFKNFKHGMTYAGHYLGCSAALLVYDEIEQLLPKINAISETFENIVDNRLGFLFSIDQSRYSNTPEVFINKSPVNKFLTFAPPVNTEQETLKLCFERLIK